MSGGKAEAGRAAPLRLTVYDLALGERTPLRCNAHACFFYSADGDFTLSGQNGTTRCAADTGAFVEQDVSIEGRGTAWLFELAPAKRPFLDAGGLSVVMSRLLDLGGPGPHLVRADRVESTPGSETPRHGHKGPGIRRLIRGRIMAMIGEDVDRIDAGRAWFESGREMVVGRNIHDAESAFVRVMVLPAELEGGKSSFIPADAVEAAKPRAVSYRLFGERIIA